MKYIIFILVKVKATVDYKNPFLLGHGDKRRHTISALWGLGTTDPTWAK